jgi:hypothetical protein
VRTISGLHGYGETSTNSPHTEKISRAKAKRDKHPYCLPAGKDATRLTKVSPTMRTCMPKAPRSAAPQELSPSCFRSLLSFYFLFWQDWGLTQGFVLAKQVLYGFSHTSGPFCLVILEMGSLKLLAQSSLEPRSSQSQPPK